MDISKLQTIVKKSPGLTVEGLLLILKNIDPVSIGKCKDCKYGENEYCVDKAHSGCIACGRYMKYKSPEGFCDEFVSASSADVFDNVPLDSVKARKKKGI